MAHIPRVLHPAPLEAGAEIPLPPERAHHLHTVLRRAAGAPVRVWNGEGQEADADILSLSHKAGRLRLGSVEHVNTESPLPLMLAQAVSRGDRFEAALQAAVELGAQAIQPLWTEFGAPALKAERLQKKQLSWERLCLGAAEQAERSRLPEVLPALPLSEWLSKRPTGLFLHPSGSSLPAATLARMAQAPTGCWVVVGPEGGFSSGEAQMAADAGLNPLRLGPRILRTEHAGAALIAALQALGGDWCQHAELCP